MTSHQYWTVLSGNLIFLETKKKIKEFENQMVNAKKRKSIIRIFITMDDKIQSLTVKFQNLKLQTITLTTESTGLQNYIRLGLIERRNVPKCNSNNT